MKRIQITPRNNWKEKVEELGFIYHTVEETYWDESVCYEFTAEQIDTLEKATHTLHDMCLKAAEHVIENKLYRLFNVPDFIVPLIERSWNEDYPSIYGRFDFSYNGVDAPKLLEYNADTPTSLYEAAVIQWYWLKEVYPDSDQFNSIHEKLIATYGYLKSYFKSPGNVWFTCMEDVIEDFTTTSYLRDTAIQAGLNTDFVDIQQIAWNTEERVFKAKGQIIQNVFKLYPWEWMLEEEFAECLPDNQAQTYWIEPFWKMLLSNKAILPILWELFPNQENLLPAYFEEGKLGNNYVKKPLYSREGANISIYENGIVSAVTGGEYGEGTFIYQALAKLPVFDNCSPVIGSWVIGGESAGIGIRESAGPITGNTSRFVPHYFR